MKKTIQKIIFECDRCKSKEEKNINQTTGILIKLDITKTADMKYGNNIKETADLCQRCSSDFIWYMQEKTNMCSICNYDFATCEAKNIIYGTGIGKDNIVACDKFAMNTDS